MRRRMAVASVPTTRTKSQPLRAMGTHGDSLGFRLARIRVDTGTHLHLAGVAHRLRGRATAPARTGATGV